jgi:hypothetical protein
MSQDLIQLARECGATWGNDADQLFMSESALSTYTARIRAEALEEAAVVCDRLGVSEYPRDCDDCASAIRSISTTDSAASIGKTGHD